MPATIGTITTDDGFEISSNYETADELKIGHGIDVDEPKTKAKDGQADYPKGTDEAVTGSADDETTEPTREAPTRAAARNRRSDPRAAVETATARWRESEREAKENKARADRLEAEIAALKAKPTAAQDGAASAGTGSVAPSSAAPVVPIPPPLSTPRAAVPPPVAAATAAPQPTQADYERYLAMPDAPQLFKADGTTPNFPTIEAYNAAMSYFISTKAITEHFDRERVANETRQTWGKFQERVQAATAADPAFPAKMNELQLDRRVFPQIIKLENAPAVMAHLHANPAVNQRILTLHPDDQVGEIREIAGYLKAQAAAAQASPVSARPAISTAKPPAKRAVGTPPAAADEPPGDDATDAEWDAYYGPQRSNGRRRRRR